MKKKLIASIALLALIVSTPAFADSSARAFIAPGSNSLQPNQIENIFQPIAFDIPPLSYKGITNHEFDFDSQLAPCDGTAAACIKSVEYRVGDSNWQSAEPQPSIGQRYAVDWSVGPAGQLSPVPASTFSEDLKQHLPGGAAARIWRAPNAINGGGADYLVSADIAGRGPNAGRYDVTDFGFRIIPIHATPNVPESQCPKTSIFYPTTPDSGMRTGICSEAYDFPVNVRFRVTVVLADFMTDLSGWFDGRLNNPTISINTDSMTIQVEGGPQIVPTVGTKPTYYQDLPGYWKDRTSKPIVDSQAAGGIGVLGTIPSNHPEALNQFNQYGQYINQTALGENSIWKLSSIHGAGQCIQKGKFNGVLSTNAPIYNPKPPIWNSTDQSLNFQVASSHLDPRGNVFQGNYSLLVSQDTAMCLWGKEISTGTATISVISADGTNQVATTTSGLHDGWVDFNASGFTFSSPTIKAYFVPAKVSAPAPTLVPAVKGAPPLNKTTSITCVKGKVSKVVKSATCPAGYKKK